jgi:RNA polymerase sigma-70 factor (ECF subfamily)
MRVSAVSSPDELGSRTQSPEALILDAERRARLTHAIAALPRRLREPLQLWHRGQHSYDEMARITGVSVGTIKSRVWEARQRVTQALLMSIAGRGLDSDAGGRAEHPLHETWRGQWTITGNM